MKAIYKLFCVVLLAYGLTACSEDSLDIEQHGVLTENEYTTADDDEVLQLLAGIYSGILGDSYEAVLSSAPASYRTFQYELNRMGAETANYYAYNETADARTYSYIWSYFYRTCAWCSKLIDRLPSNTTASESVKNQAIAEARAIRAIQMMYLVQLYGNPPLADHEMEGGEANTPASESWAWIESELNAAAQVLPSKSGLGGQSVIGGRLTKEACYAYLGKAQLWQKKYSEAAQTLYNNVIATGKYALYSDFNTYNSSAADFSDENIWEFDFNDDADNSTNQEGAFDLACFSPNVSYWWSTYASLLMTFGMGGNASADFAEFLATHDGGTDAARYKASVLDVCTASQMGMVNTPITECDGYFKVKDACLTEDLVGQFPYYYSKRNPVFMRYSEVLLNYAEAVAEGGTAGSMSGLEALNQVRRRAGLSDAPSLSMDDATYGVKAEDRAEFFGEGHRFIDLVRWGDAATELADCGKLTYTCNLGTPYPLSESITMYFSKEVVSASTGGNGFKSGKNELFPIPTTEINQNPNLTQNKGW